MRVPLTSEIALFWRFHPGRTLAVTGSNGKSTTTAMTHAILQAAGSPAAWGATSAAACCRKSIRSHRMSGPSSS